MSVKRGRGRPRKNETQKVALGDNEAANLSIITTAVSQATRKRPRKASSRSFSSEVGVELNTNTNEDEDSDFVPEIDNTINCQDETKLSRRKKTTSKKGALTPSEVPRTIQRGSTLERKGRVIRALKDLSSARDKLERIYGLNEEKLLRLAKVKEGFESSSFSVFC
ncbi:uncharacterized protein ZBAI_00669 [Zygosaccharomyces bailii ISA1307]|nr:uncharacterized protein ZBAI_00669 [Zygosaccharomyces bailii ISA1307]